MKYTWICFFALGIACRTATNDVSSPKAEFAPNGVPIDWGGLLPRPVVPASVEAKLANAAAKRLNQAAQLKEFISGLSPQFEWIDGIVSVPVKLLSNDDDGRNHPFADGQKNASLGWFHWSDQNVDPPLTLTLVAGKAPGTDLSMIIVEPSTQMLESTFGAELSEVLGEMSNEQGETFSFQLVKDPTRQVYRAGIIVGASGMAWKTLEAYPSVLTEGPRWLSSLLDRWAWPRVKLRFVAKNGVSKGGNWPVLFRFPSQTAELAAASLGGGQGTFKDSGRSIALPPYNGPGNPTASSSLKNWLDSQNPAAKSADFFAPTAGAGVHNNFTDTSGKTHPTAVGGIDTYVLKESVGKTQILYTCFDARNQQAESQWGVPSGAGWHSVGHDLVGQSEENWTFGETVLNSFEKTGIFAGWGVRTPYPFNDVNPFGANDVVTFRILRPNEAYATAKHHFHWYAVDASQKVCTIIWKHLGCAIKSDQDLKCNK